jgi:N-glycosylase/DNA lyase
MIREFSIDYGPDFSFLRTARSHGWYDLSPFKWDNDQSVLTGAFLADDEVVSYTVWDAGGKLGVTATNGASEENVVDVVKHVLRIDDDLSGFYSQSGSDPGMAWIQEINGGRLLRSPSVWEDLVKSICTTNCSWALTRKMVENLVEKLGPCSPDGARAFPSPVEMASVSVDFYKDEIRAGYRSAYLVELADSVSSGTIDPETWLDSSLPTSELKKEIKQVKGVGDYAAENLLKLLGRYDGLALDSWLRSQFYDRHNDGKMCADKEIERHYSKYGEWRGLAIWCDMTKAWFK